MKYLLAIAVFFIYGFAGNNLHYTLNTEEKAGILYMREEEKLARDVYEHLLEKYNSNPFGNIRHSEQNHMDRMEMLINNYQLNDPVKKTNDVRGKFVNSDLQKLYNDLIQKGEVSFTEALKVGAAVEEIDIADLDKELAKTDKQDIINVYTALKRASENHLNAFVGRLKMQGVDYKPITLSQEDFDDIIANDRRGGRMRQGGTLSRAGCCAKSNCGNRGTN